MNLNLKYHNCPELTMYCYVWLVKDLAIYDRLNNINLILYSKIQDIVKFVNCIMCMAIELVVVKFYSTS